MSSKRDVKDKRGRLEIYNDVAVRQRVTEVMRKASRGEHEPDLLAERLLRGAFLGELEVYDKTHDARYFAELEAALKKIEQVLRSAPTPSATLRFRSRVSFGPYFDKIRKGIPATDEARLRIQGYRQKEGSWALEAFDRMREDLPLLRDAATKCLSDVQKSPRSRRVSTMNLHEIRLVSAGREVYKLATGKAPPNSLNRESPFADFLRDVFEACGVKGDPNSAFTTWAKRNER